MILRKLTFASAKEGPGTGAAAAMTVEAFPYIMAYALSTSAGRSAIRNAIERGGGRIGPAEMGGILTALREIGQGSGVLPTEEPSATTRGR